MEAALTRFVQNPAYHDVLAILKGELEATGLTVRSVRVADGLFAPLPATPPLQELATA